MAKRSVACTEAAIANCLHPPSHTSPPRCPRSLAPSDGPLGLGGSTMVLAGPPDPFEDPAGSTADLVGSGGERALWGNKAEFFLTMVGYAVGLGNVWRFPYLCFRNGGGAFLIPYFGTLALVGLPLFFMELSFGQFASLGPIAIFSINPLFKGLGYAMVIINTIIGIYYNVIVGWTIYFLFASMTSELPWASCDNAWNTPHCFTMSQLANVSGDVTVLRDNVTVIVNRSLIKTPSEEYFYRSVLQVSGGVEEAGGVVWALGLCLLLAWLIVFFVLIKGISSLGKVCTSLSFLALIKGISSLIKVVYFTSVFPYVILTVMLVRGLTLDGALGGVLYYIQPDFSKLQNGRAWSDAATQIFFSLSTCTGGLIAMASYNPFKNNCYRDSVIVPIINCLTSFYGGFAIFSVLGYMAKQKGVSIEDVAASGPGLVFVVFPEALSAMPVAPLWSILFFIMMMILGLSSEFSIVECFFSATIDEFPWIRQSRRRTIVFRAAGCSVFFLIGLCMVTRGGFYLFNLFDFFIGGFPLLVVGFFECVVINHIYGYSNFADDIEMMLGHKPNVYFRVCWCFVSPLILVVILAFMAVRYTPPTMFTSPYPAWAEAIGWFTVFISVILIPVWFIVGFYKSREWKKAGGLMEKLSMLPQVMRPTRAWHPVNPAYCTGRYATPAVTNGNGDVTKPDTNGPPSVRGNGDFGNHSPRTALYTTDEVVGAGELCATERMKEREGRGCYDNVACDAKEGSAEEDWKQTTRI